MIHSGNMRGMSGTNTHPKKKILLVDDYEMIRRGLRDFIETEPDFEVAAEAGTSVEALAQCASTPLDIALIDLSLGEDSGLELIKDITAQFPDLKMLVVSIQDERLYAERVLRAGASGFITKDATQPQLIEAIHSVLNGNFYASAAIVQRLIQSVRAPAQVAASPLETLSDRELAVFEQIGRGEGTVDIATSMSLSVKTIETYRARIKTKLNVESSSELMKHAVQWVLERA